MILGIDLASRYSAAALVDEGGEVTYQFDSWGTTSFGFVEHIALMSRGHRMKAILIEDLPYGINSQYQVKAPLRLQGALAHSLGPALDITYFVMPSTWQRAMGVWKATPQEAEAAAAAYGYTAPDTVALYGPNHLNAKGKLLAVDRKKLEKVRTDYVDAFLIAKWGQAVLLNNTLDNTPGVQRFNI